ncbi:MAG: aspartate--tRNA ligase, partial [Pseudomonadota bacterium]
MTEQTHHPYRSHTCNALSLSNIGDDVRLSGWVHRKRDHGNLLFIDLRDHHGITQCVLDVDSDAFKVAETLRSETVIRVDGKVVQRTEDTVNKDLPTGDVEVKVASIHVLSEAGDLPMPVFGDQEYPEDIRLKYRFLDLRRERMHRNIVLRSQVISSIRRRMTDQGFNEFQTPILTASSPEGARDFLVPSRLHPGKFYALPQAPQMFKQLIMVAGFDRYFQIAPCFRDEDARADRSPGEFYQLDIEMSFVTQEDVFAAIEPVLEGLFTEFSDKKVTSAPFPRIPFKESMLKYGNDKPDLRNPIEIVDVTEIFRGSGFGIFARMIEEGAVVRAIPAPGAGARARSFFDKTNDWARQQGFAGLGYINIKEGVPGGPIAKNLGEERVATLRAQLGLGDNDGVFFACDQEAGAAKLAGVARTKVGEDLELIAEDEFRFCWVVDFPMFE